MWVLMASFSYWNFSCVLGSIGLSATGVYTKRLQLMTNWVKEDIIQVLLNTVIW